MLNQLWLGGDLPVWFVVDKFDGRAAALADRHYSRQTVGSNQTLAPGRTLLMLTPDETAVWGVVLNKDPAGTVQWRNTIFRNEGPTLSSELIVAATQLTYSAWPVRYRELPAIPLCTEVDVAATAARRSRHHAPGRCYLMAGWEKLRDMPASHGRSAKVKLRAPAPRP